MYCSIDGRMVTVRETSGRLVRQFFMRADVIGAQVNGDNIIIQCDNGWTYIYESSGRLVRETRN